MDGLMKKTIGVDFMAGDEIAERQARAALHAKWGDAPYFERVIDAGRFRSIVWAAVDG